MCSIENDQNCCCNTFSALSATLTTENVHDYYTWILTSSVWHKPFNALSHIFATAIGKCPRQKAPCSILNMLSQIYTLLQQRRCGESQWASALLFNIHHSYLPKNRPKVTVVWHPPFKALQHIQTQLGRSPRSFPKSSGFTFIPESHRARMVKLLFVRR